MQNGVRSLPEAVRLTPENSVTDEAQWFVARRADCYVDDDRAMTRRPYNQNIRLLRTDLHTGDGDFW